MENNSEAINNEKSFESVYTFTLLKQISRFLCDKEAIRARETQFEILVRILEISTSYFEAEEYFMMKTGYAFFDFHKSLHEQFISKASNIKDRLEKKEVVLSLELFNLRNWLLNHTIDADQSFIDYFRSIGQKGGH